MARRARTRHLSVPQQAIVLAVFAYLGLILVLPLGAIAVRSLAARTRDPTLPAWPKGRPWTGYS